MHRPTLSRALRVSTALLAGLGALVPVASATPLLLQAVSSAPAFYSDFSVAFEDTGDGLLEVGEITSFSGMTRNETDFFDTLLQIPDIPLFTVDSGGCPDSGTDKGWCFADSNGQFSNLFTDAMTDGGGSVWRFTITGTPPGEVPEPSTLATVAFGLFGLLALQQRRWPQRAASGS